MTAQTCRGELDDVLVAMRDGAIGDLVSVLVTRVDAVDGSSRSPITGVEGASRLPSIAEHAAPGALACFPGDVAECSWAGDAMDEGDRRPDFVGVGEVDPGEHLGDLGDQRGQLATRVDQPQRGRKLGPVVGGIAQD